MFIISFISDSAAVPAIRSGVGKMLDHRKDDSLRETGLSTQGGATQGPCSVLRVCSAFQAPHRLWSLASLEALPICLPLLQPVVARHLLNYSFECLMVTSFAYKKETICLPLTGQAKSPTRLSEWTEVKMAVFHRVELAYRCGQRLELRGSEL